MGTTRAEFVKRSRDLEWLEPIFKRLRGVIEDYIDWEEEPPYWNNEAASISMLVAAGATLRGYITLSDYRTDKKQGGQRKNGRCDLLIDKVNTKRYIEIEAKQIYGSSPGVRGMTSRLQKACKDSKELGVTKLGDRAGLLFVVLNHSRLEAKQFDPQKFKKKLASVESDLCWWWYDMAWNDDKYKSHNSNPDYRGRYFPGFAILLKK